VSTLTGSFKNLVPKFEEKTIITVLVFMVKIMETRRTQPRKEPLQPDRNDFITEVTDDISLMNHQMRHKQHHGMERNYFAHYKLKQKKISGFCGMQAKNGSYRRLFYLMVNMMNLFVKELGVQ
jgi:hypothetical protein